jgi:redox-sensitive bicupin YhaK (pirin superfamily)
MITIRKSDERGHFDHGWLDTYHTFSFADYHDSNFMGFRSLRVINEDRVKPNVGFGRHGHRDMEIVTLVMSGQLAHQDSMGNGSVIRRGDVQRMTAGTGVLHSEMNPSADEPVHLFQIWILPERHGLTPGYEQKTVSDEQRRNQLKLVASRDGRDGSVTIHQDATLYSALLDDASVTHAFGDGRYGWLQVASGDVEVNGQKLVAGDGAAISSEREVKISGRGAEILLFDLN